MDNDLKDRPDYSTSPCQVTESDPNLGWSRGLSEICYSPVERNRLGRQSTLISQQENLQSSYLFRALLW